MFTFDTIYFTDLGKELQRDSVLDRAGYTTATNIQIIFKAQIQKSYISLNAFNKRCVRRVH